MDDKPPPRWCNYRIAPRCGNCRHYEQGRCKRILLIGTAPVWGDWICDVWEEEQDED